MGSTEALRGAISYSHSWVTSIIAQVLAHLLIWSLQDQRSCLENCCKNTVSWWPSSKPWGKDHKVFFRLNISCAPTAFFHNLPFGVTKFIEKEKATEYTYSIWHLLFWITKENSYALKHSMHLKLFSDVNYKYWLPIYFYVMPYTNFSWKLIIPIAEQIISLVFWFKFSKVACHLLLFSYLGFVVF